MSRVLLLGAGPLPGPGQRQLGFPQLRTAHFIEALRSGGHHLGVVCLGDSAPSSASFPGVAGLWELPAEPGQHNTALRAIMADFGPELLVSAGPYAPLRAAAAVAGELPWWADIPGDPFAEAQARAARLPGAGTEPLPAAPGQAQAAAAMGALARADAFSVCSEPQRHALLGQLGVLGRLAISRPERGWAAVVPPAWSFGLPSAPPRTRAPGTALTVLLAGGFNTWLDEGSLLAGLLQAMDAGLDLRVVVTGGAISGHFDEGWAGFEAGVRASAHAERFELHGWVPQQELAALVARAHLLLLVDRPGAEPELGSRTRLLFGLHQGLEVAATTGCALARELAERGFLKPLEAPHPDAVAELLARTLAQGSDGRAVAEAQAHCASQYDPIHLAAPLLAWIEQPDRAPVGPSGGALVAAELAAVRAELRGVYATPTWRLLSTLHGALLRLFGRR